MYIYVIMKAMCYILYNIYIYIYIYIYQNSQLFLRLKFETEVYS